MIKSFLFIFSFLFAQQYQYIDGVAAVVENHIILKSDVDQMVGMTAMQQKIDIRTNSDIYEKLQESVIQSMIDQKIMLEMAELDSIVVDEKEVNQSLDQQIEMLINQAGSEENAAEALGQSIKSFRREFWYDMRDRMITERYQQQLLNSITITRSDVKEFYKSYKDSLPVLPLKAKLRHLLLPTTANKKSKEKVVSFLSDLKLKIENGLSFEEAAKKYSIDPSKDNGGELGWVKRGFLLKSFETVAFTLEIGVISNPVETDFGFHLIETLEKQGEKIKVRHILIAPEITQEDHEITFNLANTLKDSITNITIFKEMVKKYSTDNSTKEIGGDLGWIDPSNYPISEIGQALKYIEMNTCSPPINSSVGFHLLWVDGIKKGGRPNMNDHWSELEQMALNKKKMDWYENWISTARSKFYIKLSQ